MTSLFKSTNNRHTNHQNHRHNHRNPPPSPSLTLQTTPTPTPSTNKPNNPSKKPDLDYFHDPFMSNTATTTNNIPSASTAVAAVVKDPSASTSMSIDGVEEDLALSKSDYLTRDEVLRRRSRRLKQLARVYKDHYWMLMNELKDSYRGYYWEYGKSPFVDDEEGGGEGLGLGQGGVDKIQCAVHGCKSKAMAMTKFCHTHILSDGNQKLYVGCGYVIKSSLAGPIICGKPILRSTIPSLCTPHLQKADKHLVRALRREGLNVAANGRLAPKINVMITEFISQIQTKRRDDALREAANNSEKEEEISI